MTEEMTANTRMGGLFIAFAKYFRHYSRYIIFILFWMYANMETTNVQYSYAANFQLADDLVSKLLSDKDGNEKFKAKIKAFELSMQDTVRSNNSKPGSARQCQHILFSFLTQGLFPCWTIRAHTIKVWTCEVFWLCQSSVWPNTSF